MNSDWLSAHLDGELDPSDTTELEAALAADPALVAELADLSRVRDLLRSSAVEPRAGAIERILASVEADDLAPVIDLDSRRRVPTFAAVAAAVVIIASVVGGVGGATSVPALGDLVARHEAAAAGNEEFMADSHEMPLDEAASGAPAMPADYSMLHAFAEGSTIHLIYVTSSGSAVSVFRQPGEADLNDLPAGDVSAAAYGDVWSASYDGSYVVVVDGSGYIWIVVGSEPHDTMMVAMMDDLPSRSPSLGERLRDVADAAVRPFNPWD